VEGIAAEPPDGSQLRVDLITPSLAAACGMSRYALSLGKALTRQGVGARLVPVGEQPIPGALVRLGAGLGYDLVSFFQTYPISLPRDVGRDGGLLHLTAQTLSTLLATRRRPVPTVLTIHDIIPLLFQSDPEFARPMKPHDRLFEALRGRGLRRADAILADSECTRRDVITHCGVAPEKVHVVYLGIDHDYFQPTPAEPGFLARYGLSESTPYVLYVGAEGTRKNLHRLLQAFAKVVARVPEARLLKVGASLCLGARERLREVIDKEGLQGKALIVDEIGDGDLARLYSAARVFAFPSLYEGFGLPPLEAMACGTPVVASDRSCIPEVLGDAALLVDPCDVDALALGLVRVLEDDGLHASLRDRGFKQAAAYTWERTARESSLVYGQVMQRENRRQT
jgi:glycosyltransferase involved in cell wall biosynthesis